MEKYLTFNMGNSINCNYRIAATLYTLETWLVSGTVVNTLHKGDN
jgi:hypothetical protein